MRTMIRAGLIAVGMAAIISSASFAQQANPQHSQTVAETVDAVFALGLQTAQKVAELMAAKDKRISDVESYAKACGDKPGCFTPAE